MSASTLWRLETSFFYMTDKMPDWLVNVVVYGVIPFAFAVSAGPLLTPSAAAYIGIVVAAHALYWSTNLAIFERGRRYYLYKPNEYVDMYEDPLSRHWLVPGGGPGL